MANALSIPVHDSWCVCRYSAHGATGPKVLVRLFYANALEALWKDRSTWSEMVW
jgi:hypothetical protein